MLDAILFTAGFTALITLVAILITVGLHRALSREKREGASCLKSS
ncbi:MAG: hypothetical protein QXH24_00045 [Candidatus Bathyarchaeia archaeon]